MTYDPFSRESSQPRSAALQEDSLPSEPRGKHILFIRQAALIPSFRIN